MLFALLELLFMKAEIWVTFIRKNGCVKKALLNTRYTCLNNRQIAEKRIIKTGGNYSWTQYFK